MNKLIAIVLFSLVSLLFSCNKPSEIEVKNNSSYEVKFSQTYENNVVYSVNRNQTIYIPARDSACPNIIIKNDKPVKTNYGKEFYLEFIDLPSYTLHIENHTSSSITFSIENSPSTPSIAISSSANKDIVIYTKDPIVNSPYKLFNLSNLNLIFY